MVGCFKKGLHVLEMAKEGANTDTRSIGDLLGCGDQYALLLQRQCRFDDGESTTFATKAASVYSFGIFSV